MGIVNDVLEATKLFKPLAVQQALPSKVIDKIQSEFKIF